jgi:hypothetical protein
MTTSIYWSRLVPVAVLAASVLTSAACAESPCTSPDPRTGAHATEGDLISLLKGVDVSATWESLSMARRNTLQAAANSRLQSFRSRWGPAALKQKEGSLLDCPSHEMLLAMDDFYRKSFSSVVAADFSLDKVPGSATRKLLVRSYLASMAALRSSQTYPNGPLPNRDWDGVSPFDSVRLPDEAVVQGIRDYATQLVADWRTLPAEALLPSEKALMRQVLYVVRAISEGGFSADSFGGFDMATACEIVGLGSDIVNGYRADKARPVIFTSDEDVVEEANAIYLHNTTLRWLDVGTFAAATNLDLCTGSFEEDVKANVAGAGATEVAHALILFRKWWIERNAALAKESTCSKYSAADRSAIWDAFTADQHVDTGATSMESYSAQLTVYREAKVATYQALASDALARVFPDAIVLTDAQRQAVMLAISQDRSFGSLTADVAAALDVAQKTTNGPAASAWNAQVATRVKTLGGGYKEGDPLRSSDKEAVEAMRARVTGWLAERYRGYPIDLRKVLDSIRFSPNSMNNAVTDGATGEIRFGIGTKRSLMEYYSLLLHEYRHAVAYVWRASAADKSSVVSDEGTALEGSGVAAEELLREPFLRQVLNDDLTYALYALDFGIRDARQVATTDATLQKYLRTSCVSGAKPDSLDFSRNIAISYGLTGVLADTLALRAHAGTQYFQYISAGIQVLDNIAFLQREIDPTNKMLVDPYLLFECSLNNPRRDDAYIGKLKACIASKVSGS